MSEQTATVEAQAPASEARPSGASDDQALDSVLDALNQGDQNAASTAWDTRAGDDAREQDAGEATEPAPGDQQQTETDGPPLETAAAESPVLEESDLTLLQRFGLEADDLPSRDDRRQAFLVKLRDRAAYEDGLGPQVAELRRQNEEYRRQTQPQLPDREKAWASLHAGEGAVLDEGTVKMIRAAVGAELAHVAEGQKRYDEYGGRIDGTSEGLKLLGQRLTALDIREGLAEAQKLMPEGVNLSKADARAKVLKQAHSLLAYEAKQRGFSLGETNLATLIPRAAQMIFSTHIQQTNRQQRDQRQRQRLRGTPDTGGGSPTVRARRSEDEALDAAFDALNSGASVNKAANAFAGE